VPVPLVFLETIAYYIYKENFQPLISFLHVHVVEVKNEESKEKENIYLVLKEQHTVLLKTAMDMYFLHVQVYFWN
jgi:hypothetical protein